MSMWNSWTTANMWRSKKLLLVFSLILWEINAKEETVGVITLIVINAIWAEVKWVRPSFKNQALFPRQPACEWTLWTAINKLIHWYEVIVMPFRGNNCLKYDTNPHWSPSKDKQSSKTTCRHCLGQQKLLTVAMTSLKQTFLNGEASDPCPEMLVTVKSFEEVGKPRL